MASPVAVHGATAPRRSTEALLARIGAAGLAATLLPAGLLAQAETPGAPRATPPLAGECSLAEPLWYGAGSGVPSDAHAWHSGRRSDGVCELVFGGWAETTWTSGFGAERPDGLAAPAAGAVFAVSGGVQFRRGPLEIRVVPEVAWHENGDVEVPGSEFTDERRFGYRWAPIDWPFRHGPDAFALVGPGRSGVRLHVGSLSVGVDAEPVRWGPSRRYPILLSGQQASLPRVGIRTERPWRLGRFGTLDANLMYARLASSDWFAASPAGEARILAGFTIAWGVGFLPGLEVGVSSLHHQDADEFGLGSAFRYVQSPAEDPEDNSTGNGIGNLWLAWSSPERGFDVWLEILKDDFNRDVTHLLLEPEKGSARTFGLRQEVSLGGGAFSVHLETTRTRNVRPLTPDDDGERGILYTHRQVREGHTHRGQMLGAIVGPGGDGQFLELRFRRGASTAVQLERLRFNTDAYTEALGAPLGDTGYDVELVGRLLHERPFGEMRARGTLEVGGRHNRLFLQDDPSWEGNVRLGVMLLWSR